MRRLSNSISKFGLVAALLVLPSFASADAAQYVGYGNQMLAQRQYDKAIQYYGAAAKADPRNASAYKGLGYAAMGKRDTANGIKYMEYAIALNPADQGLRQYLGKVYQGYGNQYYQRGDKASALAWWNKAVKTDPSNTQLAGYVASLSNQAAAPSASAPAAATASADAGEARTPGVNPWIMGGTVAVLGAVMLFIF
jgi:tetratricopeptide (TPR) repeat protein